MGSPNKNKPVAAILKRNELCGHIFNGLFLRITAYNVGTVFKTVLLDMHMILFPTPTHIVPTLTCFVPTLAIPSFMI